MKIGFPLILNTLLMCLLEDFAITLLFLHCHPICQYTITYFKYQYLQSNTRYSLIYSLIYNLYSFMHVTSLKYITDCKMLIYLSLCQSKTQSCTTTTNNLFWLNYLTSNLEYIFSSSENIIDNPMTSVEHFMWKETKKSEIHSLLPKITLAFQLAIKLKIIAERPVVVELFSFQDNCCKILSL